MSFIQIGTIIFVACVLIYLITSPPSDENNNASKNDKKKEKLPVTKERLLRNTAMLERIKELFNTPFVVVDTETTGIGDDAEIVELAIVDSTGKVIFESLIKPQGEIAAEAMAVHGISKEAVQDAPYFKDIAEQVFNLLNNKTIVAHNSKFDSSRLDFEFERVNLKPNYCALTIKS